MDATAIEFHYPKIEINRRNEMSPKKGTRRQVLPQPGDILSRAGFYRFDLEDPCECSITPHGSGRKRWRN